MNRVSIREAAPAMAATHKETAWAAEAVTLFLWAVAVGVAIMFLAAYLSQNL